MLIKQFLRFMLRSLLLLVIPKKLSILHLSSCYKTKEKSDIKNLDDK